MRFGDVLLRSMFLTWSPHSVRLGVEFRLMAVRTPQMWAYYLTCYLPEQKNCEYQQTLSQPLAIYSTSNLLNGNYIHKQVGASFSTRFDIKVSSGQHHADHKRRTPHCFKMWHLRKPFHLPSWFTSFTRLLSQAKLKSTSYPGLQELI